MRRPDPEARFSANGQEEHGEGDGGKGSRQEPNNHAADRCRVDQEHPHAIDGSIGRQEEVDGRRPDAPNEREDRRQT